MLSERDEKFSRSEKQPKELEVIEEAKANITKKHIRPFDRHGASSKESTEAHLELEQTQYGKNRGEGIGTSTSECDNEDGQLNDEEKNLVIETVKETKLYVAIQGLQRKILARGGNGDEGMPSNSFLDEEEGPSSMRFRGLDFHRNSCYHYKFDNFDVIA
jgi:hypothetical protein